MKDWRNWAACRGMNPNLFVMNIKYMNRKKIKKYEKLLAKDLEQGLKVCEECPVKEPCKVLGEERKDQGVIYGGEYRPFELAIRNSSTVRVNGNTLRGQANRSIIMAAAKTFDRPFSADELTTYIRRQEPRGLGYQTVLSNCRDFWERGYFNRFRVGQKLLYKYLKEDDGSDQTTSTGNIEPWKEPFFTYPGAQTTQEEVADSLESYN